MSLSAIESEYQSSILLIMATILYVVAISHMLCAGYLALRALVHENKVSVIPVELFVNGKERDLKESYDCATNGNNLRNVIRNNYVFSSYSCIRNALVCLFIVFVFVISPTSPI